MIEWLPEYATGVEEIDEQHRDLFDYINQLEQCINDNEFTGPRIEIILNFLSMFCTTHFCLEETCMRQRKCPVQDKNKKAHDNFLQFFKTFQTHYKTTNHHEALIKKLHASLDSWLKSHILKIDIHLRSCKVIHTDIF